MTKIEVKGTIISDAQQRIYDWIGLHATSPSKVIKSLPTNKSDIEVSINSGGGDVFAGSEIYTALKEYEGQVTVKVVGIAASAASVIAMAGDKVLISPTAQMMIHNVSTYGGGDYRDFEHTAEVLKSANHSILNSYKAKTGKSEEELKSLMDAETWFNAKTAVETGFADEEMFVEKENQSNTFVANGLSPMLGNESIDKINAILGDLENDKTDLDETFQAKLKLLKLKGVHL